MNRKQRIEKLRLAYLHMRKSYSLEELDTPGGIQGAPSLVDVAGIPYHPGNPSNRVEQAALCRESPCVLHFPHLKEQ